MSEDGEQRGPGLPAEFDWPVATRRWWETWRSSAQAQTFTPTDWDFLLDTALLHSEYWAGNTSVGAELRLRVAKFGATPEDRARLRLQVEKPEADEDAVAQGSNPPPSVARMSARRKRLTGAG